jgi:hypothetical protein
MATLDDPWSMAAFTIYFDGHRPGGLQQRMIEWVLERKWHN